ncbi:hypothetical protein BDV98DRAFT_432911 [Pterulicium gracile]|uniref:Uncharacterized protein n=1 Tax=Pterulicium gracile TaxID=1884261 RepID=A0A5C3QMK2_9AGAR|nr:hypothetical protein BDV98DRAFT_432911 [Pterula gracilis]
MHQASGASTLCDELLATIFLMDSYNSKEAPWNLAAVCKDWRRICLFTPELWTRFDVTREHFGYDVVDKICIADELGISRCCRKLERSQACPIHVDVNSSRKPTGSCSFSMLRALAQHAHRWKLFRARTYDEDDAATLLQLLPPSLCFSTLQRLDVDCAAYSCRFALENHFTSQSFPAITSLRLKGWGGSTASST